MRMSPYNMLGSDPAEIAGATVGRHVVRRVWAFARPYRLLIAGFLTTIVLEFVRGTRARKALGDGGWWAAFSGLVARNRRRYGGYVVHASIVVLLIGAIGIGGFSTTQEARLAAGEPSVDYLGVGALFATPTKADAEYGGPQLLRSVRAEVDLPLVAIGGITMERAAVAWQHGADLIAVVSAVFGASDPAAATRALLASKPSDD